MDNAREWIADDFLKRTIDLERFSAGERKLVVSELKNLEKTLINELKDSDLTSFQAARLEALLQQTKGQIAQTYKRISKDRREALKAIAKDQKEFAADAINSGIGGSVATVFTDEKRLAGLVNGTLIDGAPSANWWNGQNLDLQKKFENIVRGGYLTGQGVDQMTKGVKLLMNNKTYQAEALVRTSVQAVANAANKQLFEENTDVISGVQQLSSLDSKTTPICISYSGLVWKIEADGTYTPIGHDKNFANITSDGASHFGPPRHWQCRSTLTPVTKTWDELAGKQITNGEGDPSTYQKEFEKSLRNQGFSPQEIKEIKPKQRAAMEGPVSKDIGFDGWLKRQTVKTQIDTLGAGRWKLWKDGKITLQGLTDQSGRPLSIADLSKRRPKPKIKPKPKPKPPKPPLAPPPPPKPKPIPPEDFIPAGSPDLPEFKRRLREGFENTPKKFRDIVARNKPIKVFTSLDSGGAYYNRHFVRINQPKAGWGSGPVTMRHEYAHHLDAIGGEKALTGANANMDFMSNLANGERLKDSKEIMKVINKNFVNLPDEKFMFVRMVDYASTKSVDYAKDVLKKFAAEIGKEEDLAYLFKVMNPDRYLREISYVYFQLIKNRISLAGVLPENLAARKSLIKKYIDEVKKVNIPKTKKFTLPEKTAATTDPFEQIALIEKEINKKSFLFSNEEIKTLSPGVKWRSHVVQSIKDKDVKSFLDYINIWEENPDTGTVTSKIKDFFGAITDEAVGQGHGKAYYELGRVHNLEGTLFHEKNTGEAFAEYFCLISDPQNGDLYRKVFHYFAPNISKKFDDLIEAHL